MIMPGYARYLKECGSLDFDDLLIQGVQLFKKCPKVMDKYSHTLVDEFQVLG